MFIYVYIYSYMKNFLPGHISIILIRMTIIMTAYYTLK